MSSDPVEVETAGAIGRGAAIADGAADANTRAATPPARIDTFFTFNSLGYVALKTWVKPHCLWPS